MITISPEALDLIRAKGQPIHLDMPPIVQSGCCMPPIQECPAVRFGAPGGEPSGGYDVQEIQGVTVHVPRRMPRDGNFKLQVSSFLGFRRVVLEGWHLL